MQIKPSKRLGAWAASLFLSAAVPIVAAANGAGVPAPTVSSNAVTLTFEAKPTASVSKDPTKVLQVFTGKADDCCEGRTAVAGRYERSAQTLSFVPVFGFAPDQDYVVQTQLNGDTTLTPFKISTDAVQPSAEVTAIYPSADALPENVLRFYIHFAAPMAPHVAFDYIKLRDASGKADDAAFMKFKQELWNKDRTRLTVLVDPGRIKRDVATNVELGPALLEGERYTLSVEEGWPAADGNSRLSGYSKTFAVGKALRTKPDAVEWAVTAPCFGTRDELHITFDRLLDRHQLPYALAVSTEDGARIAGGIEVGEREMSWRFKPDEPWSVDAVRLTAQQALEDVAGNNFKDLLDSSLKDQADTHGTTTRLIAINRCSG